MKDLVIFAPCGAYKETFDALLARHLSLRIRAIQWHVVVDVLHDSSQNLDTLARIHRRQYTNALALRDLAGSGWETQGATALEGELRRQLSSSGWATGAFEGLVVEPEIEEWLRMPSTHVSQMIKERARRNRIGITPASVQTILAGIVTKYGGYETNGKPKQPKEVFEGLLEYYGIPRANSLYRYLAEHESLQGCASPTFNRLVQCLRTWFP